MPTNPPAAARPAVLVVEDETTIRENVAYALESDGFEPIPVATGGEARALLRQREIALAILDVGLPDVSGFDLCRELRAAGDLPILFLTARGEEIDRVVGLEIGADDYVAKPFSPRELTARVRAILRRSARSQQPGAERSHAERDGGPPLTIDEERLRALWRGRPLDLARYEFRLLRALSAKPGRVFSRAQLMDLAWEEPESAMERTVDAHVKSLRAKLRAVDPDADPIQTRRGEGYSWEAPAAVAAAR